MTTIQISGHPLKSPMTFSDVTVDEYLDENHWLLTRAQAEDLIVAWRDAERIPECDCCDGKLWAAYRYHPMGIFMTALYLEHELTMDEWESAYGADDFDLYSTSQVPFEVEIKLLP